MRDFGRSDGGREREKREERAERADEHVRSLEASNVETRVGLCTWGACGTGVGRGQMKQEKDDNVKNICTPSVVGLLKSVSGEERLRDNRPTEPLSMARLDDFVGAPGERG